MARIYTRTGDGGTTQLVGGQRVAKDSLRIDASGAIDELNSVLGVVRMWLAHEQHPPDVEARLHPWLEDTQNLLFELGSELATQHEDFRDGSPRIGHEDVRALETLMDDLLAELPPLRSFVIPGGGQLGAHLHLARTVCRRAERAVVALSRDEAVGEQIVPFVNRLSDALFVWSRWVNLRLGQPEPLWTRRDGSSSPSCSARARSRE